MIVIVNARRLLRRVGEKVQVVIVDLRGLVKLI
jgi:hypothetical protein